MDSVFGAVLFFGLIAGLGILTAVILAAGAPLLIDPIRDMKEKLD